jgi:flagellar protein FliO/FliZ
MKTGFYLGGEKLKLPLFALLFFGAGLLVIIPFVSAQEIESAPAVEEQVPSAAEDSIRVVDQSFLFGEDTGESAPAAGPSIWAAVRMVLVLALAAAAVYGVVFFIKRTSKQPASSDPFLKILASSPLGSNRYAHIVSVGGKAWLLGSSDGGVNLIGEIDDKDVINAMLLEDSRKSAQTASGHFPDFTSMLRLFGTNAERRIPGAEDIRKRRERLKELK